MKNKLFNFLFETSSRDLRRKHIRTLWLAIGAGVCIAVVIGGLLYIVNKQGRL